MVQNLEKENVLYRKAVTCIGKNENHVLTLGRRNEMHKRKLLKQRGGAALSVMGVVFGTKEYHFSFE